VFQDGRLLPVNYNKAVNTIKEGNLKPFFIDNKVIYSLVIDTNMCQVCII
jgi:hypothetical protein